VEGRPKNLAHGRLREESVDAVLTKAKDSSPSFRKGQNDKRCCSTVSIDSEMAMQYNGEPFGRRT
jgi:hypothetical protein